MPQKTHMRLMKKSLYLKNKERKTRDLIQTKETTTDFTIFTRKVSWTISCLFKLVEIIQIFPQMKQPRREYMSGFFLGNLVL